MKKIDFKNPYIRTALIVLPLLVFLYFSGIRLDLTQEKRYTLSEATVNTLKSVKDPLNIEVYLEGEFPANFKQLRNETEFLLEEFRKINPKISFEFIDPIASKMSMDTLQAMGMQPSMLPDFKDGKVSQIVLFPYAALKHKGYGSSLPLIINQTGIDATEQLNKSIENLEFNFISHIKSLVTEKRKNIGVLINQDELRVNEFRSFMEMALQNYNAGPIIPANRKELTLADVPQLKQMDALVIAKPRKAFTNNEKLILDQYIINGGKTLWMIDAVNAELDTLMTKEKMLAYPIDINMTDFFFNYGIRINAPLVKDFQKSALRRLQVGEISGNPQYVNLLWPYFPLGINENNNPITRNINPVKFEFPTAIDTLGRKNIKTKVMYESSPLTTLKSVPNYVQLSELANIDSLSVMEKPTFPKIFAVSLEGDFSSAYASRSERNGFPDFTANGKSKMIVISDGDVGRNAILKGEPLPLGADMLTGQQYGNEQFLRNCLDWLLDDDNLIDLRNRNIEARLIDRKKADEERTKWQWLNLLTPLFILGLLGGLFFWMRKRKFE